MPSRSVTRCVADHDASAASAKNAAMKKSFALGIASARQASSASSTNSVPNSIHGDAAAGSMRASTGKTNSRIGAA